MYGKMLDAGLNCPLSSGMGRLFDGISAILGIKMRCSYEGQGAILLEAAAVPDEGAYDYSLTGEPLIFDWRETVRAVCDDMERGVPTGVIASRFMNTLVVMAAETCVRVREKTGLSDVCLSGGTFQNMYLMRRLPTALEEKGFTVHRHSRVSCNDEGISLGQTVIAMNKMENKG